MRILVAFGTRPEIIKLGPVCRELSRRPDTVLEVFWTGQHIELAVGLLDLFEIHVDHIGVDVMQEPGLAGKFGQISRQIETLLRAEHFDWIIVQGDTTTAAAASLAGFSNKVPVAHVEAGLRTGDLASPWPEEFNRRIITLSSSLHFAPTHISARNLAREGVGEDAIEMVGNTIVDALLYTRDKVRHDYTPIDPQLASLPRNKKLVLATLHRRENIGEPIREILRALRELGEDGDKVITLPVHMNPEVRAEVLSILGDAPNVFLLGPLQYPDFVHMLDQAWTVVTDSGGVQEEAPTFGLQILITRESTERPECIEAGFGTLVGSNRQTIIDSVRRLTSSEEPQFIKAQNPFGDGMASLRIVDRLTALIPSQVCAAE